MDKWIAHFSANALGRRGEELSEQSWGVDAVANMSYFVFVENWEPQGVCLVDWDNSSRSLRLRGREFEPRRREGREDTAGAFTAEDTERALD